MTGRGGALAVYLLSLCVLLPGDVLGQEPPTDPSRVVLGDAVRVRLQRAQPIEAVFLGWDADRMLLDAEGLEDDWPVSVFDMAWLEVYTARSPREGLRHYAILGAVSGLFIGAGIGLGLHAAGVIDDPDGPPALILANTLKGAGLGTVGGLITGGVLGGRHPGSGWIALTLPAR